MGVLNAKTQRTAKRAKKAADNPPCPPVWQYLLVMGSDLIALGEAGALIFRFHTDEQLRPLDDERGEFMAAYSPLLEKVLGRKIAGYSGLVALGKATIALGPNHTVEELEPLAELSDRFIASYRNALEFLTGWEN